jgi:hypothetical protein
MQTAAYDHRLDSRDVQYAEAMAAIAELEEANARPRDTENRCRLLEPIIHPSRRARRRTSCAKRELLGAQRVPAEDCYFIERLKPVRGGRSSPAPPAAHRCRDSHPARENESSGMRELCARVLGTRRRMSVHAGNVARDRGRLEVRRLQSAVGCLARQSCPEVGRGAQRREGPEVVGPHGKRSRGCERSGHGNRGWGRNWAIRASANVELFEHEKARTSLPKPRRRSTPQEECK